MVWWKNKGLGWLVYLCCLLIGCVRLFFLGFWIGIQNSEWGKVGGKGRGNGMHLVHRFSLEHIGGIQHYKEHGELR